MTSSKKEIVEYVEEDGHLTQVFSDGSTVGIKAPHLATTSAFFSPIERPDASRPGKSLWFAEVSTADGGAYRQIGYLERTETDRHHGSAVMCWSNYAQAIAVCSALNIANIAGVSLRHMEATLATEAPKQRRGKKPPSRK
ncbi:MAG: hypothetical protein ABR551_14225 [Gemmatimonadales bacterium]